MWIRSAGAESMLKLRQRTEIEARGTAAYRAHGAGRVRSPSFLWFGTCACASRGKARIFAGLNRCGSCPEAVCARFAAAANELPGATRGVLEDFRKRLHSRVPTKTGSLGRSKCKKLNQIKTIVLNIIRARIAAMRE